MGDTSKQVRVDNWGIFFLSRLQVFFNKTDYCDLTLQFEGNVQLKVHRLVMNACTEYFQMLEQTCEVVDDVLLMPPDLQADVILPIVNFMYTGMLEFQMSIFDKLYKTAELMNITVLLKLLDAQKQPHHVPKSVVSKVSPTYNLQSKKITPKVEKVLPAMLPGRKLPVWKRKNAPLQSPTAPTSSFIPEIRRPIAVDPLASYDNSPKPTRFEWPEDDLKNFSLLDSSFDTISYTSKPLLTQEEELRAGPSFDDVRYLPSSNKKPKDYNSSTVDMEDLKSYVKEQKIRSDMVEYDDDEMDNDFDMCDPDYTPDGSVKRKVVHVPPVAAKKVRFNVNEKENKDTKINVTQTGKNEVDHSKIISEVLKKYPHLVKKNKNIRLKILAKGGKNSDTQDKPQAVKTTSKLKLQMKPKPVSVVSKKSKVLPSGAEGPWACEKCSVEGEQIEFVLYYLYRKHMTDVHNEKFDSRMCTYCGHKSTKHNMLMYHQYTKHGIKPPAAYNFPKCNQCPYVALTENLIIKHKLNHTKFDLQCSECKVGFNSENSLKQHVQITGHTGKSGRTNYDCQYCTKHYQTGANLFSHIRLQHREEARRDGIVSIDEEDGDDMDVQDVTSSDDTAMDDKVKILSNITLPTPEDVANEAAAVTQLQNVPLESQSSEAEALNSVASGIATSLGLVDIVVLEDSPQYILHSNDQQLVTQQALANNQEFILPELTETHTFVQNSNINQVITTEHNVITQSMLGGSDIASTDELVMVLTDHDYNDGNNEILTNDNSNIVVLYSHPVEGQSGQFIASQGNLLLNSETGMLELRNGAIQNDGMQANTVESIEMIQREIESQTIADKNVQLEQPPALIESPVEKEYESPPLIEPQHDPEYVTNQEQLTQVEQKPEEDEEPNIESEPIVEPESANQNSDEQHDITNNMEPSDASNCMDIDPEEPSAISQDTEDNMQSVLDEASQNIENAGVAEQIPELSVENPQVPGEDISMPPEELVSSEEVTKSLTFQSMDGVEDTTPVDESMEVPEGTIPIDGTNDSQDEVISPPTRTAADETPIDNEIREKELDLQIPDGTNLQIPDGTNLQIPDGTNLQIPDGRNLQIPDGTPEISEADIPKDDDLMQSSLEEANEVMKCGEEVIEHIEKPQDLEQGIQEQDHVPEQIEAEVTPEAPDGSTNDSILEETEQQEQAIEENTSATEEVNTAIDESGPMSADTQIESQDDDSQKSATDSVERIKAAKISILDDWEDTDSQQSEHGKSANTVNKLINDWDDD